jgi:hypothetical protein
MLDAFLENFNILHFFTAAVQFSLQKLTGANIKIASPLKVSSTYNFFYVCMCLAQVLTKLHLPSTNYFCLAGLKRDGTKEWFFP